MVCKGFYLGGSVLLFVVVLLLVFWGCFVDVEIQVLKVFCVVVWKDFFGVNVQFFWFSLECYNKQIDCLQDLGLEWVCLDLYWDCLEIVEDQYQLVFFDQLVKDFEVCQLKLVFYLVGLVCFIIIVLFYLFFQDQYLLCDLEVFVWCMVMFLQCYLSVVVWQVWNEFNLIGFWWFKVDLEGYVKLFQVSIIVLCMVDLEKLVVFVGMVFFSEMFDGCIMFDVFGYLGVESFGIIVIYYFYIQLLEGNYLWNLDFVFYVNQINCVLCNVGVLVIWSIEWGWLVYKGLKELQDIIGVEGQVDYVLCCLVLMSVLDYDWIFFFIFSDFDQCVSVCDCDYGLFDLDVNFKLVYLVL